MTVASFRWWFTSSGERGEAIIALELRRLGWKESVLSRRPTTDSGKPGMAARLREETTVTLWQIAQTLKMGTRNTLSAKPQERKGGND
jgi:hypothetical protein